jgi:hypothetical protein
MLNRVAHQKRFRLLHLFALEKDLGSWFLRAIPTGKLADKKDGSRVHHRMR